MNIKETQDTKTCTLNCEYLLKPFHTAKMSNYEKNTVVRHVNLEKKAAAIAARRAKQQQKLSQQTVSVGVNTVDFPPLGTTPPLKQRTPFKPLLNGVASISFTDSILEQSQFNQLHPSVSRPRFSGKVINLSGKAPRRTWFDSTQKQRLIYHRKPALPCPEGVVTPLPEFKPFVSTRRPKRIVEKIAPLLFSREDFLLSNFVSTIDLFTFLPETFEEDDDDDDELGFFSSSIFDNRVKFPFTSVKLPKPSFDFAIFKNRLWSFIDHSVYFVDKEQFLDYALRLFLSQHGAVVALYHSFEVVSCLSFFVSRLPDFHRVYFPLSELTFIELKYLAEESANAFASGIPSTFRDIFTKARERAWEYESSRGDPIKWSYIDPITSESFKAPRNITDPRPKLYAQGGAFSLPSAITATSNKVSDMADSFKELANLLRTSLLDFAKSDPVTLENGLCDMFKRALQGASITSALVALMEGHFVYGITMFLVELSNFFFSELNLIALQVKTSVLTVAQERDRTRIFHLSQFLIRYQDLFMSFPEPYKSEYIHLYDDIIRTVVPDGLGMIHGTVRERMAEHHTPLLDASSGFIDQESYPQMNRTGKFADRLSRELPPHIQLPPTEIPKIDPQDFVKRFTALYVNRSSTSAQDAFESGLETQGFTSFFSSPFAALFNLTIKHLPTLQKFNTLVASAKNVQWITSFITDDLPKLVIELITPLFGDAVLTHSDLQKFFSEFAEIQRLEHAQYRGITVERLDCLLDTAFRFRTLVASSLLKGASGPMLIAAIRDLQKIRLYKTDRSQFEMRRYTPYTVLFHSEPGVGKSQLLPVLAKWFHKEFEKPFFKDDPVLRDMCSVRSTYALQPQLEFMDGYAHDSVVIQDEALSQSTGESENMLLSLISNNVFVCPMASLEDGAVGRKGTTFTSAVVLLASNRSTFSHLSAKFLTTEALERRVTMYVHTVKVGPYKSDFSHLRFSISSESTPLLYDYADLTLPQLLFALSDSRLGYQTFFQQQQSVSQDMPIAQPFDLNAKPTKFPTSQLRSQSDSFFSSSFFSRFKHLLLFNPSTLLKIAGIIAVAISGIIIIAKNPACAQSYTMDASAAQRTKRVIREPFTQGFNMNQSDILLEKLKGQMHIVTVYSGGDMLVRLNAIPLHSVFFIVPKHLFEKQPDEVEIEWFGLQRSFRTSKFKAHNVDVDTVCLELPDLPWRPASFYKHLPDEADLAHIKQTPAVIFTATSLYPTAHSIILNPLTSRCTYSSPETSYTILSGFTYDANTRFGDCGGPIIACDNDVKGKLVGMHVAGTSNSTYAVGVSFQREHFTRFIDGTVLEPSVCTIQGSIAQIGVVTPALHLSRETSYVKRIHDPPLPQIKVPSNLHIQNGIDPILEEIKKNSNYQAAFSITSDERGMIMDYFNSYKQPLRILSDIETITGAEGLENINVKTSCGYPLCLQYTKRDFFEVDEFGTWTIKNDLPLVSMRNMEVIAQTRPPYVIWKTSGKDELLKPGKNIRVFEIPPLDYTLCFRKYFGHFIAWFSTHPLECHVAIGLNPESHHWDLMVRSMLARNDVGFNTDWTRYDSTVPFTLLALVTEIANEWYDDDFKEVRRNLTRCLFNRPTVVGSRLLGITCGLPSGFAGTAVFNSIVHVIIVSIYYLRRAQLKHRDLTIMRDHLAFYVYGDDGVIVPDPEISYIFDWESFLEFATELGMHPTPAAKDASDPHCAVRDMSFLKRSIAYDRGLYIPQLSHESMFSMLTWLRSSKYVTLDETYKSNLRTFYGFAYFHGRQFYTKWAAILGGAPSYTYFDHLFRSGSMDLRSINI